MPENIRMLNSIYVIIFKATKDAIYVLTSTTVKMSSTAPALVGQKSWLPKIQTIHPSIHFLFLLLPLFGSEGSAGAYPSYQRARGGVHPG